MKKNFYYLFIMLMMAMVSVGFASCGDDDDDDNGGGGAGGTGTISGSIVGTWKIVQTEGYKANGALAYKLTEKELGYRMYYQFRDNGTVSYYEFYLNSEDYWTDGDGQKHFYDEDRGTYTYSNSVIMVYGDEPVRMEVINLTSTELKVKFASDSSEWSYDVVTMRRASDSDVPSTGGGDNDDDEIDTPTPPESGDTGSYASNILGTWQWVNTTEYYSNGTVNSFDATDDGFDYIRFNKDKTMDDYFYYYKENRWFVEHCKYGISGNTLIIINGEDEINCEIVSLTHSELIIGWRENADLYDTSTYKKVDDSVLDGAEK